ncbi:hypothetical protein FDF42_15480 [Clostridium botulinum]|nr:hypothetical protein [Clostridium botulinum]NFR22717.1 hypothetical protein [Clostridium botulinum]
MNLKKLLIPCIVAITLFGTVIIPSTVVNAATSCQICGERVYPGQNHVCSW